MMEAHNSILRGLMIDLKLQLRVIQM